MSRFRLPDNYDDSEWLEKQERLEDARRERRAELKEDERLDAMIAPVDQPEKLFGFIVNLVRR